MLKKIIYIFFIGVSLLHSEVMNTDRETYTTEQNIIVSLEDLRGASNDWIVIYPAGTANGDYGEIIQWQYTGGGVNETVTFNNIPREGTYDIRVLYGADRNTVVSKEIIVGDEVNPPDGETTLTTDKDNYTTEEDITVTLRGLRGASNDWIVLYPKGTANGDYGQIIQWQYTGGGVNETVTFNNIPRDGAYDIRVLYGGDQNTVVSKEIIVGEGEPGVIDITARKDIYSPYELIHIDFVHMRGIESDSVGIFASGAGIEKANAIELRSTNGLVDGELSFNGLVAGTYEARAYFNNEHQKTVTFTVQNEEVSRILYDDFEDGVLDPRWVLYLGRPMVILNLGVPDGGAENTERKDIVWGQRSLRTYNGDHLPGQSSGYFFDFDRPEGVENPDPKLKFLDIDMRIGNSSHRFAFGVKIKTKFGDRRIEFASFYNHVLASNGQQIIRGPYGNILEGHKQADTVDNYLHVHPAPSDYYVATSAHGGGNNKFVHFRINIEEKLRIIEPDNEFLGITLFTTSGGDYDNLALATQ